MKKPTLAFLIADGFEDIELFSAIDICKRGGINCILYSVDNLEEATSAYGIKILIDNPFNELKLNLVDGIVIPGGPAVKKINNYFDVHAVIQDFHKHNKLLAAICAGPSVLEQSGILKNVEVTCYPTVKKSLKTAKVVSSKKVVTSKNIITADGPSTAIEFGLAIVKYFYNSKTVNQIKKDILLKK